MRSWGVLLVFVGLLGGPQYVAAEETLVYDWCFNCKIVVNAGPEQSVSWDADVNFFNPYADKPAGWDWSEPLYSMSSSFERAISYQPAAGDLTAATPLALVVRDLRQGSVRIRIWGGDASVGALRLINNPDDNPKPGYSYDPATGILSLTGSQGVEHGTALLVFDPIAEGTTLTTIGMQVLGGAEDDSFEWSVGRSDVAEFDIPDGVLDNPSPDPGDRFGEQVLVDGDRVVVLASGEDVVAEDAGLLYLFDRDSQELISSLRADAYLSRTDFPDRPWSWLLDMADGRVLAARSIRAPTAPLFRQVASIALFDAATGEFERALIPPAGGQFLLEFAAGDGLVAVAGLTGLADDVQQCSEGMMQTVFVFDAATGELVHQLDHPNAPVSCSWLYWSGDDDFGTGLAIIDGRIFVSARRLDNFDFPENTRLGGQGYVYSAASGALIDKYFPFGQNYAISPGLTLSEIGGSIRGEDGLLWVRALETRDPFALPEDDELRQLCEEGLAIFGDLSDAPYPYFEFCFVQTYPKYFPVEPTSGQRIGMLSSRFQNAVRASRLMAEKGYSSVNIYHSFTQELLLMLVSPDPDQAGPGYGEVGLDDFVLAFGEPDEDVFAQSAGRVYLFELDKDGDQMADAWETKYGLDPTNPADAGLDADGDLLTNLEEYRLGSRPDDSQSDADGLSDGREVRNTDTSPILVDADFDNLADNTELDLGTDPRNEDTDNDRMRDGWEVQHGLNPLRNDATDDADSDGLMNRKEQKFGTDPNDPDSDDDRLRDGGEVFKYGSDPLNPYSDEDRLRDGYEVRRHGTDPTKKDTDDDGLLDGYEIFVSETDPLAPDSDGDTMPDGWERENGTDPLARDGGQDPDDDGLTNRREASLGLNPFSADTDRDGMPDAWEVEYRLGAADRNPGRNPDGDPYTNLQEYENGTNPRVADP